MMLMSVAESFGCRWGTKKGNIATVTVVTELRNSQFIVFVVISVQQEPATLLNLEVTQLDMLLSPP